MELELMNFRRNLHAHPELSGQEKETQRRIKEKLSQHGIQPTQDVGQFGTLYTFRFGDGPHLLVRVDIDALAIREVNDFEHRSTYDGISHKCGHDGHATIGVGLALKLQEEPLVSGTVSVLFQPSEENGEGARGILDDPSFDVHAFDAAVALHNIPGAPHHQVLWKYKNFTPAVQSLIIRLKGRTAHAAQPLTGENPTYAISEIVQEALRLEETDEKHPNYRLITPVYTEIGSKDYGNSAGYGEIHFTIRSWLQKDMEAATEAIIQSASNIATQHRLAMDTEILAVFAANQNAKEVVDAVRKAAGALDLDDHERSEPFPWGEDFGLFTQHIPGAMFGLGSGVNTPALHNPDYDYPDDITLTGVNLFYEIAKDFCVKNPV